MVESVDEEGLFKQAEDIVSACGGAQNISGIDSIISRLEVAVVSRHLVNLPSIRDAGAISVVLQNQEVQIIVGERAEKLHYLLVKILDITPAGY